ncbi:MAG: flagellar type III secretion system protein FlhB [Humidesulfovibrio sp.]|uniref:flagellar type III secretion system protein FlhB n=1 Tax=Humidesulfovibrio sp. TaxID=2910988 RepID=UPI0027358FF7|nr:flagellar type III secretion system protein FlhB [Humidesulfovibrio sp.]MDP2848096.1 flagellar type III secretion system protein FlhB [Humidesulfovibrio sp.]
MSREDPSRTEKATPKRIKKARDEGSVAKSAELSKVVVLLAGVVAMRYMGEFFFNNINEVFHWFFTEGLRQPLNQRTVHSMLLWSSLKIAYMVLPVMLIIAAAAYITMRLQVGKLWSLKFQWDRINLNIFSSLKQMMASPETLVRLGRDVAQALAVGIAPYIVIKQELPNLIPLFHQNIMGITTYMLLVSYKMICYALVPMILIALADLWWTRYRYEDNLMMTKGETKDERRQMEGDPEIKQKQLRKMFEVMGRRLNTTVPKADVVITNPTHYAIALRYDVTEAPAPMVLAKGVDRMALKIREIAIENDIPLHENPPLAQALYKQVEIGETIPEEMYQAVAAILAKLAKFKKRPT